MDLSFQEKSLWLLLLSLLVVFGGYFALALPGSAANVMPQQVVLFVLAVVVLVISQVASRTLVALTDRQGRTDERDKLIALKGTRNAAYVLASGVFLALCVALLVPGNFAFTHVLLGSWVLAQLVEIASQLFMYRRGA